MKMPLSTRLIDSYILRFVVGIMLSIPLTTVCIALYMLMAKNLQVTIFIAPVFIFGFPIIFFVLWDMINIETRICISGHKLVFSRYIQPFNFESDEFDLLNGNIKTQTSKSCGWAIIKMFFEYDSGSSREGPFTISYTTGTTANNLENDLREMLDEFSKNNDVKKLAGIDKK